MDRITIVSSKFGSHLYGTDTPNSDKDYRGVFLPTKAEVLLGQIPKSIHLEGDTEYYSLHYFIKLACDGQTVAFDMLHSNMLMQDSDIWTAIKANKHKFYSKNIKAFIGYARTQAAKYSLKGERLITAKKVIDVLNSADMNDKLSVVWDKIAGDHIYPREDAPNGINQVQVCGKVLQETMNVHYAKSILESFVNEFGQRAKKAEISSGKDWKAISHAVRVLLEVEELLMHKTITFPLLEHDLVRNIKLGKVDLDYVITLIDQKEIKVNQLLSQSTFPEQADRAFWERFLINTVEKELFCK